MLSQIVIAADIMVDGDADPQVVEDEVRAFLASKYGRTCLPTVRAIKTKFTMKEREDN